MQRVIWLAPDRARCVAQQCSRADHCASRQVAPTPGRPVADPTVFPMWRAAACGLYVSLDAAVAPQPERRVHPPMGA